MLIFVDESGNPNPADQSPYSVLAAIALQEECSRDFSREIFNLKRMFKGINDPIEWEIHARDLLSGRFIPPTTREFMKEIFSLCRMYKIVTFASIMKRPTQKILIPEENPHIHDLYKYLMRRVDAYVNESFPEQTAIFLFDSKDKKSNERLARRFTSFLYKSKKGQEYHHILDTPFFVDSRMTPGIQIVDLFAYIINRRFQKKNYAIFNNYYKEIKELQFECELEEGVTLRGIKFIKEMEDSASSDEAEQIDEGK